MLLIYVIERQSKIQCKFVFFLFLNFYVTNIEYVRVACSDYSDNMKLQNYNHFYHWLWDTLEQRNKMLSWMCICMRECIVKLTLRFMFKFFYLLSNFNEIWISMKFHLFLFEYKFEYARFFFNVDGIFLTFNIKNQRSNCCWFIQSNYSLKV